MLFMKSQIIYSCPSCFRFGLRLFHSVSRLIPHLQIINLRCYTVVAGEPDVVTSEVSERRATSETHERNRRSVSRVLSSVVIILPHLPSVTVVVPCLRHSTTSGSLRSSPEGPLREDEVRKGRSDERSDRPTEPQTTGGIQVKEPYDLRT